MTERKTYLFFIFNEDGAPLYVNAAGNVEVGDPTTLLRLDGTGRLADLDQAPGGWQGILVKYARNMSWFGLFRDMTVPMEAVGDMADILFDSMWNHGGVECVRHFGIMLLDRLTVPYIYNSWYLCELDFKKYNQKKDSISIQALEGGLSKYLNANDSIVYPIDLDVPTSFHVVRDGINLTERANFEVVPNLEIEHDIYGTHWWLPLTFINKEGASSGVAFFSQSIAESSNGATPAFPLTSINYFSIAGPNPNPIDVTITGNIVYQCIANGSAGFRMRFLTSKSDFANQALYDLTIAGTFVDGETYTIPVNIIIPLSPGESAYLQGIYFGGGITNPKIQFLPDSKLQCKFSNRMPTTYSKEMYAIDLLKAIVSKMSEGKYTAASAWLTAKKDLSFTSGDSIRFNGGQLQHKIEKSLKDFIQDLRVSSGESVGAAIRNNVLIVEPLSFFFTDEVVVDLGEIGDLPEVTVLEDLIYNEIRAGYEKQEYENVNGKIEFNQGQDWKLPILRVKNKLNLESTSRADPIGTEIYRIEVRGLDTTDKQEDKNSFVSKIETVSQEVTQTVDFVSAGNYMTNPGKYPFNPGGFVKIVGGLNDGKTFEVVGVGVNIVQFDVPVVVTDDLAVLTTIQYVTGGLFKFSRPAYTSIVGIPDEMKASIYNTEITPKQAILNNGEIINAGCDQLDTKLVEFIKADMNDLLETTIGGVTLKQKQNIQIAGLKAKLWKPYAIKIKTKTAVEVLALIDANPFGKVKFTLDGQDFFCSLMDGGVEPETMAVQEWVLLPSGTTDMRKLKIRD